MYVYGRHFKLLTDHKPLTILFGNEKLLPVMVAARIQRWAMLLAGYSYTINYRPTSQHANADALSRLPCKESNHVPSNYSVCLPVCAKDIANATAKDSILTKIMYYVKVGWPN
jgi:hypothetical protein